MKPKNKLQSEVLALQKEFKKITRTEVKKIEAIFDHTCGPYYKNIICHECLNKIGKIEDRQLLSTKLAGIPCPTCKKEMVYKEGAFHHENGYVGKYDVVGRFQVIRIFYGEKRSHAKEKPKYFVTEVMRHFIDPAGKLVTISRETLQGSFYSPHLFKYGTDWTVHNNDGVVGAIRYKLHPYIMLDGAIQSRLLKMGYNRQHEAELNPHQLIRVLFQKPIQSEILLKAGQVKILYDWFYYRENLDNYWSTIKIACRHKYFISDPKMYYDYLNLLVRFGKDIRNPHYICPENVKKAHDHYMKKAKEQDRKKKIEELKAQIEADNIVYKEEKQKYFNLVFEKKIMKDKNLRIETLKDVESFMETADDMSNCLFTNAFHKESDLLVMVAKVDSEPVEVAAINLRYGSIYQCYGPHNKKTTYNLQIEQLIKKNMNLIKKAS